jgi:hypothetical protein
MVPPISRKTVHIGVFIPTEAQLLDMACVDIFGSMSHEYLSQLPQLVPEALRNLAPCVQISCGLDVSETKF